MLTLITAPSSGSKWYYVIVQLSLVSALAEISAVRRCCRHEMGAAVSFLTA